MDILLAIENISCHKAISLVLKFLLKVSFSCLPSQPYEMVVVRSLRRETKSKCPSIEHPMAGYQPGILPKSNLLSIPTIHLNPNLTTFTTSRTHFQNLDAWGGLDRKNWKRKKCTYALQWFSKFYHLPNYIFYKSKNIANTCLILSVSEFLNAQTPSYKVNFPVSLKVIPKAVSYLSVDSSRDHFGKLKKESR
jgi:hypothetical protein